MIILFPVVGCSPSTEDLKTVDYTPFLFDDWEVSTLEEQDLNSTLVYNGGYREFKSNNHSQRLNERLKIYPIFYRIILVLQKKLEIQQSLQLYQNLLRKNQFV